MAKLHATPLEEVYRHEQPVPRRGTLYRFYCPGCRAEHEYHVRTDGGQPSWTFNGDRERPTFQPSLLRREGMSRMCHLFLTEGRLQFLGDCSHDLRGQTVDLPDLPEQPGTPGNDES